MNRISLWLLHTKLSWNGDPEFDLKGCKTIPCKKCGQEFKSWQHYDTDYGIVYDSLCDDCVFQRYARNWRYAIIKSLQDYDHHKKSWQHTKDWLRRFLIKIDSEANK